MTDSKFPGLLRVCAALAMLRFRTYFEFLQYSPLYKDRASCLLEFLCCEFRNGSRRLAVEFISGFQEHEGANLFHVVCTETAHLYWVSCVIPRPVCGYVCHGCRSWNPQLATSHAPEQCGHTVTTTATATCPWLNGATALGLMQVSLWLILLLYPNTAMWFVTAMLSISLTGWLFGVCLSWCVPLWHCLYVSCSFSLSRGSTSCTLRKTSDLHSWRMFSFFLRPAIIVWACSSLYLENFILWCWFVTL